MTLKDLIRAVSLATLLAAGSLPWSSAAAGAAGVPLGIQAGPGSEMRIEGGSNIHDWESRSTTPKVAMTRDSSTAAPASAAELQAMVRDSHIRGLVLEVPVLSLHSKKSGLDKNLYKDLLSDEHPVIRFTLDRYTVVA